MGVIKRGLEFLKDKAKNSNYAIVSFIFRILLGFIYLTIFVSLSFQVKELIGSKGLLPIAELVKNNPSLNYFDFPTLHLFFNSDAALFVLLFIGIIFSITLILGYFPRISLIACFAIYLSYVASGREFFYFQWDNLLLESSFLTLFLPLKGRLFGKKSLQESSILLIFLFRWLLFRLYFESGIAKLLYGQNDWLKLSAMKYYYETAPLPSFGGWFAQQLMPGWFHVTSVFVIFFLELIVPLFLFYPRKLRIFSFYLLTFFNLIMLTTSNYGFFNFLAIFLGIFLLDDKHILNFKKINDYFKNIEIRKASGLGIKLATILIVFIVPFSIFEYIPFAKPNFYMPDFVANIQSLYRPYRIIDRYHLFPGIVKERIVIEFVGSNDKIGWKSFYLKHTPSKPDIMPPFLILHQARFPFQYSFVTLGQINSDFFRRLIVKLCKSPNDIENLLIDNPFETKPLFLRLDFYKYKFSAPKQLFEQGLWWDRQLVGTSQVLDCSQIQ